MWHQGQDSAGKGYMLKKQRDLKVKFLQGLGGDATQVAIQLPSVKEASMVVESSFFPSEASDSDTIKNVDSFEASMNEAERVLCEDSVNYHAHLGNQERNSQYISGNIFPSNAINVMDSGSGNARSTSRFIYKASIEEKVWSICEDLGVTYQGSHNEMIKAIGDLEERDIIAKFGSGEQDGFP